jgi:hypothetical protein
MRVLLPLLFCSCSAVTDPQVSQTGQRLLAPVEPRFHWASPELFDAFVPSGEELQLLDDGHMAVSSRRAFALEFGKQGIHASEFKQRCTTDLLLDVVRWKAGLVWLRTDKYGNLQFDADLGSGAEPFPRPDKAVDLRGKEGGFSVWAPAPRLAVDGDVLVLFAAPWIHRYEHEVWTSVKLDLGPDTLLYAPGRALLVGRKLYLGVDKGEWGGQLIVADIDTGRGELDCRKWNDGPWNVTDIDRGPDGKIYVTCGIAHGGVEASLLIAFDGTTWSRTLWADEKVGEQPLDGEIVEEADGSLTLHKYAEEERIARVRHSIVRGAEGTSVPRANFQALAFDDQERPCVLSSSLGLLRQEESGEWSWLTPGWPRHGPWVTDLAFVGKKAVITSRDAGVIVLDLKTLEVERVRLE